MSNIFVDSLLIRLKLRKKVECVLVEQDEEGVIDTREKQILTAQKNIINQKEIQAHRLATQAKNELDRICLRRFN